MATFTWNFDAPTGTYKNHAMSTKLHQAAVEKSVFVDYARPVDGYGRKRGESVTLTRIARLTEPSSAVLIENERIPEDSFSISTKQITVQELGRSVPFTSLSQDLSEFDLENPIQSKLREQMTLVLDTLAAAALTAAQVKYVPTGPTSKNIATTGTAGAQASSNMNVWHVEEIRDYMVDTLFTPMLDGENYVGIFRTLGLRGIKRDSDFEEWHKYTSPEKKLNSEVGKLEQIRFVETNHNNALGKIGASSVLGEGVVIGEDALVMAEAMTPELRAAMPTDFGRARAVAWIGLLKFSEVWDTGNAGQARCVHVTST